MATIYDNEIQKLYVAYFNRPADPAGLAYWGGVVEAAKGDTAGVSAAFAASAEYKAAYADFTVTGTLKQIYVNLFNGVADDAGLAYWSDLVATGKLSMDKAVTAIAAGAQGVHKTTYANKVLAAAAFTTAVNTDAEKAAYSGAAANTAAKAFLAGVSTDASLTAALVPATLDASVAAVVKASVPFTLASALASYDAAVAAKTAFLVTADGDGKATTSATDSTIAAKVAAAEVAINTTSAVSGDVLVTGYAAATAASVKAAILAEEVITRAAAVVTAQTAVNTAAANTAKVAGLTEAFAAAKAATAGVAAANTALAAANGAQSNAELVYEGVVGNGLIAIDATTGVVTGILAVNAAATATTAASVKLATGVTEATNPGVTALLNAVNAQLKAVTAQAVATKAQSDANIILDMTDNDAAAVAQLTILGTKFTATTTATIAAPTAAQINAETAALASKAATALTADATANVNVASAELKYETANAAIAIDPVTGLTTAGATNILVADTAGTATTAATVKLDAAVTEALNPGVTALLAAVNADLASNKALALANDAVTVFKGFVDTFIAADATNTVVAPQIAAEATLKTNQDKVNVLNAEIVVLNEALAVATQLKAANDAIASASATFTANKLVAPVLLSGAASATVGSDIFVPGTANASVLGFGKGDMLYIGTKFTATKGAVTVGNDAVLEAFLTQVGSDVQVSLETKTFGFNSTGEAEIVITLTGVNLVDITVANGIISI